MSIKKRARTAILTVTVALVAGTTVAATAGAADAAGAGKRPPWCSVFPNAPGCK